jgi:predicted O-linked N-acetylglucosamine transferase (SPINDLY family)/cephalosporin hydroxylase/glycosyltransferase involved in cell wall biosynthesis
MPKHLLLYTDDHGIGGVAQYNHSILLGLVESGYRVTSVQSFTSNPLIDQQKQRGIQHEWLYFDTSKEFTRTVTNIEYPQAIFVKTRPDLIIFSDCCPISNFAAKQVAIHLGIPYIVVVGFVGGYLANHFGTGAEAERYMGMLGNQYQRAKAVVAVSQENLDLLHQLFRLPANQGQVIHYGRPEVFFAPRNPIVRDRLRREIGIPDDGVVCFTAARLEVVKGFQYQLDAIVRLRQTPIWSQVYFVWAGDGVLKDWLDEAIQNEKLSDHVKLLGQRWDIVEWHDAADIFVLPSEMEGMPLAIMEAMAKGVPVIASAVSGIPEEVGDTGKLLPDPKVDSQKTIAELVATLQEWASNPELRGAIGQACQQRAAALFKQERMLNDTLAVVEQALGTMNPPSSSQPTSPSPPHPSLPLLQQPQGLSMSEQSISFPPGDYVSPGFALVKPDHAFSHMIVGNTDTCPWPYLRREIPHNWYVDERSQVVGFLSRDEAHILYNSALQFKGKRALEIGCWMGWSACHLALAGVQLDVVDPMLDRPEFYQSVSSSLEAAGVLDSVTLIPGFSPRQVEEFAAQQQRQWSLIFIDGDHEAPGPLRDAIACDQLAEPDAMILFHDLASPDVAQGLDYLRQRGWHTLIYQTMQIMGVAWRGNVQPVHHQPDPSIHWKLPSHLAYYTVSSLASQPSTIQPPTLNPQPSKLSPSPIPHSPTAKAQEHVAKPTTASTHPSMAAIPTPDRAWNTSLPRETLLAMQQASQTYTYRGVPLSKNPFDLALYPMLLWHLKPRTIIAIGSQEGGSTLWLGDMFNTFGIDGRIYSIAVAHGTHVQHPRVTFIEGDSQNLAKILSPEFLSNLPRPLLVIDSANHTYDATKHSLEFFHPYLKAQEYIVVEAGIVSDLSPDAASNNSPHRALKEFLATHGDDYEIDAKYCDFFGYNLTWNINGYLKKLKDTPIATPTQTPPIPQTHTLLDQLLNYVEQVDVPTIQPVTLELDKERLREWHQQARELMAKGDAEAAIATFNRILEMNPGSAIAHHSLSTLYWQQSDIQNSVRHQVLAHSAHTLLSSQDAAEFQEILAAIRPYTLLRDPRLLSLYRLAKQICLDDIPGNFVECGTFKGGAAALLATVIKRYSARPRLLYACDTFEGMPDPIDLDKHEGIPANLTNFGAGTLKAPIAENLKVVCQTLNVQDIVVPIQGLFADTLPQHKSEFGSIALLHADGDWYESTLDIFNHLYDSVISDGVIQIDDYGFWEGCRRAIQDFAQQHRLFFPVRVIDDTGVWFRKQDTFERANNYWHNVWQFAQIAEKLGNSVLAQRAAKAVLRIIPHLLNAEEMLIRLQETEETASAQSTTPQPQGQTTQTPNTPTLVDEEVPLQVFECFSTIGIRSIQELKELIQRCQNATEAPLAIGQLRRIRQQLAEQWLSLPSDELQETYLSPLGQAHYLVLTSGIRNEPRTKAECLFQQETIAYLSEGLDIPGGLQHFLAAMLYLYPHQCPSLVDPTTIPEWLMGDYLKFALTPPQLFQEVGEIDKYSKYLEQWTNYLYEQVFSHQDSQFWQSVAVAFNKYANFIPLYFTVKNWRDLYIKRANILEFAFNSLGYEIDYVFPERSPDRQKIRVGILAAHFSEQSETFATLPLYEHLDRDQFELVLLSGWISGQSALEQYCFSQANSVVALPQDIPAAVNTIRNADLDILVLATNVTAVTNFIAKLAIHRLARVQVASVCSCMTTGMRHVDYYISGQLAEPDVDAQQQYAETLMTIEGPAHCYNFGVEEQKPVTIPINREHFGIRDEEVVYISGANFYKITPELAVIWAKLLASVPYSRLVLYPFNKNWSASYPARRFREQLLATLAEYGVREGQLTILDPVPHRADVKARLSLGDVYLDSFPFSGVTSLVDPLEVGLPVVALDGNSFRSRMGPAFLRSLQLPELIAPNEDTYLELAIALGINPDLRQYMSDRIQQAMQNHPVFLDSRSYSAKMATVFQQLFSGYPQLALQHQYKLREINLIAFPDWNQSEELLIQDLVDLLRGVISDEDRRRTTLLIYADQGNAADADLAISGALMQLLAEEDLEVDEVGPEISLISGLSQSEWQALLPLITTRLALQHEDGEAIAQASLVMANG